MTNLKDMSDDELQRRIMMVLQQKCDQAKLPYPFKLVQWLERRSNG